MPQNDRTLRTADYTVGMDIAFQPTLRDFWVLGNPGYSRKFRELVNVVFNFLNSGLWASSPLRPLHLDAHKIRVAKHCRDYNVADAIYAMLEFRGRQTLANLREYLDEGREHPDEPNRWSYETGSGDANGTEAGGRPA